MTLLLFTTTNRGSLARAIEPEVRELTSRNPFLFYGFQCALFLLESGDLAANFKLSSVPQRQARRLDSWLWICIGNRKKEFTNSRS